MLLNLSYWVFLLVGILAFAITMGLLLTYFQQVRNALLRSEERFRAISTYTYDWEIWLGTDGKPLWINAAANRMTGISNEEAQAMSDYPLPLVAEQDRAAVRAALALVAEGGIIDDQIFRVCRRDNSSVHASLSARQIYATGGALLGTRLSIRDVSVLIHYQAEMERKRTLLQSVLDNTSDGIIALNQDFRVIFYNNRFLELWGLSRTFLNKQPSMQELIREICHIGLYPSEEADDLVRHRIEHLTGIGDKIALETPRQDGVIVEGFATPLTGIGYLLTYRDVTAQTLATREVQRSHEHYRTLIETVPHGIIECDLNGQILYANPPFEKLAGLKFEELKETLFWETLSPPEGAKEMKGRFDLIRTEKLSPGSEFLHKLDRAGKSQWWEIDWNIVHNEDGQPSAYIAVVTDITERKTAQAMFDDERLLLNTLIQSLPDPVWFKDVNGIFLACNAAFGQLYNDSPSNIIGRKDNDYVDDELAAFFQQKDREAITACRPKTYEEWVTYASDGHRALWETTKTPIVDIQGQVVGALGVARDITERKAAEKKERELAAFIQTILDAVPAPIFYKDADGLYLGCNTAFERYLGKSRSEVIGKSVFDLAPPDLAQIYYDADRELLRQGGTQSYETQVVFADGNRHDVFFSKAVFAREDDAPGGLVGAMLDITERRHAELALQESEARYKKLFHESEMIFNGIPDSLTVWSSEMRVLWANASSGGQHKQVVGKSCHELCAIDFAHQEDCEVLRSFASGELEEGIHRARDGRTWGVKAFPLRNAAGAVDRVIRLASDLTERMILRAEAARTAHLAALGELAAGMAHEINNPTSLILLEMPILQEVFRDSAEILEEHFRIYGDFSCGGLRYSKMRLQVPAMIEEILDSAERIRQIVEELRDFSHPTEANQFKAVDLNEAVRKALSLVGNQIKKATDRFAVTYAPAAPRSLGSLQRLEQVAINLVINACQALPDREGSLTVEVGSCPERRRNFIRVADTGIGIMPEHLKLITDPFFTTRRAVGGTGLGLSVSTRIIEEHGGTLHFASEVGEGTTVTIELPMLELEEQP